MNFIRRAICRLHTGRRNIIPLRTRVRLLIKQRLRRRVVGCNVIARETRVRLLIKQRLPQHFFVLRNVIAVETRVRLLNKQRLPQHFVRLERGVYPLSLLRSLNIAHLHRLPPHMPSKLGHVLVDPIRHEI